MDWLWNLYHVLQRSPEVYLWSKRGEKELDVSVRAWRSQECLGKDERKMYHGHEKASKEFAEAWKLINMRPKESKEERNFLNLDAGDSVRLKERHAGVRCWRQSWTGVVPRIFCNKIDVWFGVIWVILINDGGSLLYYYLRCTDSTDPYAGVFQNDIFAAVDHHTVFYFFLGTFLPFAHK